MGRIRKIYEKLVSHQFDVIVGTNDGDLFDICNQQIVKCIKSSQSTAAINPVVIDADPFLFVDDGVLYLFYEEQVNFDGKGVIRMSSTTDLKHWSKSRTVLTEEFHLSYPNVFSLGGKTYMLPETGAIGEIRLYEPGADFTTWKHTHTLLRGETFVDSTILESGGNCYLFTTIYHPEGNVLRLYVAASPEGPWQEHPQNPLCTTHNGSRCAGSIFGHDGKLYRPAQRDDEFYGSGVDIYEIAQITPEHYSERLHRERIIPCSASRYRIGGHHFNPVHFKGQQVVATDCLVESIKLKEVFNRIIRKLK